MRWLQGFLCAQSLLRFSKHIDNFCGEARSRIAQDLSCRPLSSSDPAHSNRAVPHMYMPSAPASICRKSPSTIQYGHRGLRTYLSPLLGQLCNSPCPFGKPATMEPIYIQLSASAARKGVLGPTFCHVVVKSPEARPRMPRKMAATP